MVDEASHAASIAGGSFLRNREQGVFRESKSCVIVIYLPLRKVPPVEMVPNITCYCARPYAKRARSQNSSSQGHPERC